MCVECVWSVCVNRVAQLGMRFSHQLVCNMYAFLCVSMRFYAFLCVSMRFSAFLCVSMQFSAFLCVSLRFSAFHAFHAFLCVSHQLICNISIGTGPIPRGKFCENRGEGSENWEV